jgi:hypothetical protein
MELVPGQNAIVPTGQQEALEAIRHNRAPSGWLVFYGRPSRALTAGRSLLVASSVVAAVATGALAFFAHGAASTAGGVSLGVLAVAFGVLLFLLLIPTTWAVLRHRLLASRPEEQFVALGPDGVYVGQKGWFSSGARLVPWPSTEGAALRYRTSTGGTLTIGNGVTVGDTFDMPAPVLLQAIQTGHRLRREGQPLTGEAIAYRIDPECHAGKPVAPAPLSLDAVPSEAEGAFLDRIENGEAIDGVRFHPRVVSAARLRNAGLLFLGLSLTGCLAPIGAISFLHTLFSRAKDRGRYLAFLPEGFVLKDETGLYTVPWSNVSRVVRKSGKIILTTDRGELPLECDAYGLDERAFESKVKRLKATSGLLSLTRGTLAPSRSARPDGGAHLVHRRRGDRPGLVRAFREDLLHVRRIPRELFSPRPRVVERGVEQLEELDLVVTPAEPALVERAVDLPHLLVRREELEQRVNGRRVSGLGRIHRGRIGRDAHDALLQGAIRHEQIDRVLVALAHLLVVGTRHRRGVFLHERRRQTEDAGGVALLVAFGIGRVVLRHERQVELGGDVPRDLQVLELILPHGHDVAAVEQDVGGHEHRVREQTHVGRNAVGGLVLERVRALEQAHRRDGREVPKELGDLGNVRLPEQRRDARIEPEREVVEGHVAGVLAHHVGAADGGERVVVRDEEERLALVLQVEELLQRAEVVADVKLT